MDNNYVAGISETEICCCECLSPIFWCISYISLYVIITYDVVLTYLFYSYANLKFSCWAGEYDEAIASATRIADD